DRFPFGAAESPKTKFSKPYVRKLFHIPTCQVPDGKKIFLARNVNAGRSITNMEIILRISESYGFEFIETDNLSLDCQISLFPVYAISLGHMALDSLIWPTG
ncbi:MAG: hypothetical protein ACKOYH_00350, partial [Cyanobium sp.]